MAKPDKIINDVLKRKERNEAGSTVAMGRLIKALMQKVTDDIAIKGASQWDVFMTKQLIASLEDHFIDYNRKVANLIDLDSRGMWELGLSLIDGPLMSAEVGFNPGRFAVSRSSLNALLDFELVKLKGVSDEAMDKIRSEVSVGIIGGKTPGEVIDSIGRTFRDTQAGKSVWGSLDRRAEVIVQTEMGRIFSVANQERMDQAAEVVGGLMKEWRHANKRAFGTKPKVPRRDHLAADGQKVPVGEAFNVSDNKGYKLRFPRDPKAGIDAVINCNCDHVPWMDEWAD